MSELTKPNGGHPPAKPKRPVSVFALASRPTSVSAAITVDDVLEARPNWTRQQAAEFLSANAEIIGQEMVVCGAEVLIAVLGSDGDVN